MAIYYIETERGCGLREAEDIAQARAIAKREVGELVEINAVRPATEFDIGWVQRMGGYVPGTRSG